MSAPTCICEHAYEPKLMCVCGTVDAPRCPKCGAGLWWTYSRDRWECVDPHCRHHQQLPHPRPKMTEAEFSRIINEGALYHPMPLLRLTRAWLCLFTLANTVPGCAEAFRRWCTDRDLKDEIDE